MIDRSFFENHFKKHSLNRRNFRYFSEIILDSIAERYYQEIIQIKKLSYNKEIDTKKLKLFIKKEVFQKSIFYVNTILNHYIYGNKKKIIFLNIEYNEVTKFLYDNTDNKLIKLSLKKKYLYIFNFYLKFFLFFILSALNKFYFSFLFKKVKNYFIGINFVEGIDPNKRNDFFWYDKGLFSQKCLIYFNSYKDLFEFKKTKNLYLDKENIKQISPLKLKFLYFNFSFNFIVWLIKLNCYCIKDRLHFFFFLASMNLNLNKWYNFFKFNNIKVHYENQEGESSHILKNLSLDYLNGFSFSKERTLMSVSGPYNYYGSFSADIRFHNNILSLNNFRNTHNISKYNLLSYYPYKPIKNIDLSNTLLDFNKKNFSKTILFFDSNHSAQMNMNELAMLPSSYMENIYEIFINLIEKYNIGLLIKSKKIAHSNIIFKNKNISKYLNKNIYIIDSPFGITAESLKEFADFSVSVGTNLSSALIEFISFSNKPGLFLNFHESYHQNNFLDVLKRDNLVIDDLSYFKHLMTDYLEGNDKIGDWNNHVDDISIKSLNTQGHKRITFFIDMVFSHLSKNKDLYLKEVTEEYYNKFT